MKSLNWRKILFFVLGAIILSGSMGGLISLGINDFIREMDEKQIERMLRYPLEASLFSAFKLYIVAYILFNALPQKVKQAPLFRRAFYFTLFYVFCTLVYVMI